MFQNWTELKLDVKFAPRLTENFKGRRNGNGRQETLKCLEERERSQEMMRCEVKSQYDLS